MGEGFTLWSLAPMAWEGREPLRDWIYLSVSAFCDSTPSPFLKYPEIRNSDWGESFAQIFLIKLRAKRRESTALRVAHESPGRACLSRGHLGHRFALILLPKNHKYSKKISVRFYPVWTPFDIGFL